MAVQFQLPLPLGECPHLLSVRTVVTDWGHPNQGDMVLLTLVRNLFPSKVTVRQGGSGLGLALENTVGFIPGAEMTQVSGDGCGFCR
jgi:hypothetical protein